LTRVDKSKKTLELVRDSAEYPTEIDPSHPKYQAYNRVN
jgi:hypothetical protein